MEYHYQIHIVSNEETSFYEPRFPISQRLISGVERSLRRSQNIDLISKNILSNQIEQLKNSINQRLSETIKS